jgi:hypothetical protein
VPIFRDEKEFLPLQAADLYVWQLRRLFFQNKNLYVPPNEVLKLLESIPSVQIVLRSAELRALRQGAEQTGVRYSLEHPNVDINDYRGTKAQKKQERKRIRAEATAKKRISKKPQ